MEYTMKHYNKHYVEELTEEKDEWKWAVMWKEKVVCVTWKEEWADQIAWAIDEACPYTSSNGAAIGSTVARNQSGR